MKGASIGAPTSCLLMATTALVASAKLVRCASRLRHHLCRPVRPWVLLSSHHPMRLHHHHHCRAQAAIQKIAALRCAYFGAKTIHWPTAIDASAKAVHSAAPHLRPRSRRLCRLLRHHVRCSRDMEPCTRTEPTILNRGNPAQTGRRLGQDERSPSNKPYLQRVTEWTEFFYLNKETPVCTPSGRYTNVARMSAPRKLPLLR